MLKKPGKVVGKIGKLTVLFTKFNRLSINSSKGKHFTSKNICSLCRLSVFKFNSDDCSLKMYREPYRACRKYDVGPYYYIPTYYEKKKRC